MDVLGRDARLGPNGRRQSNARWAPAGQHDVRRHADPAASAVGAFNSNQFWQGFSAGPKVSLTYHDPSGVGVEFSYFNIFTQSATKTVGPHQSDDAGLAGHVRAWFVLANAGFPYQGMAWKDSTNLYSPRANARLDLSPRVASVAAEVDDPLVLVRPANPVHR